MTLRFGLAIGLLLQAWSTALSADLPEASKPPIWAVYYIWYQTPDGPHAKWHGWTKETGTTNANPQPSSKAHPLIGYYDSDNPEVVRWHIQLAKAGGINAFLVDWWGGRHFSGPTVETTILPIAEKENFKIALCNELGQFHRDLDKVAVDLIEILQKIKSSPAYLHMDGKPVVYLYQVPFAPKLTPATFLELTRTVEKVTGPVYWMMDKVMNRDDRGLNYPEDWLRMPEVPMMGFYGTFSIKRIWTYDDLLPEYTRLVGQAHRAGKKTFLPVHPGLDNSGIQSPWFIIPRENGATLKGYLKAATNAGADVLLLTSFNEWPETTVVEPSSSWNDPYQYLKALAGWNGVPFRIPKLPRSKRQTTNGPDKSQ